MTIGRPFEFPNPDDRSVNEPHVIVERPQILGLYNQAHPGEDAKKVSETVKNWFIAEALKLRWNSAKFVDSYAVLEASVVVNSKNG